MRIVYYALKNLQVGEDIRVPGDLVPEAKDWPFLSGYLSDGSIAPVLVATLPEAQQQMLLDWEAAQEQPEPVPVPDPEPDPDTENDPQQTEQPESKTRGRRKAS